MEPHWLSSMALEYAFLSQQCDYLPTDGQTTLQLVNILLVVCVCLCVLQDILEEVVPYIPKWHLFSFPNQVSEIKRSFGTNNLYVSPKAGVRN